MSLPEITPERLADHELVAIQLAWAMVEEHVQAAASWPHHPDKPPRMVWRTPDHVRLTRLLAHSAWLTAERDHFRQMALDYQADRDELGVAFIRSSGATSSAPALTARELLARVPVLHDPAVTEALAGAGDEPEEASS